jgi:hypothetical protein
VGARNPDSPGPPAPPRKRAIPRDTSCKVRIGRVVRRGVAALTPDELRFHTGRTGRHGEDFFLHLRFEHITSLVADGPAGTLTVATAEQEPIVFHLGRLAVAWKQIIEDRPDLLRELGVGARSRVALVAVDDDALLEALAARGPGLAAETGDGLDVLFAGVHHRADLARLDALAARVKPGGVMWVVYPTGSRGLTETAIVDAARAAGLAAGVTVEVSPRTVAMRMVRLAR